jgi:hypothetical protein
VRRSGGKPLVDLAGHHITVGAGEELSSFASQAFGVGPLPRVAC